MYAYDYMIREHGIQQAAQKPALREIVHFGTRSDLNGKDFWGYQGISMVSVSQMVVCGQ